MALKHVRDLGKRSLLLSRSSSAGWWIGVAIAAVATKLKRRRAA
jgi:hypothetical protein